MSGFQGEKLKQHKKDSQKRPRLMKRSNSSDQLTNNINTHINEHFGHRKVSTASTVASHYPGITSKAIADSKSSKIPLRRKRSSSQFLQHRHSPSTATTTTNKWHHVNDTTFASLSKARTSHRSKSNKSNVKKLLTSSVAPKSTLKLSRMKLKDSSLPKGSSRNVSPLLPATSNHNKRNLSPSNNNNNSIITVLEARQKSHITKIPVRLKSKVDSVQGSKLQNLRSRQNIYLPTKSEIQLQDNEKFNPSASRGRKNSHTHICKSCRNSTTSSSKKYNLNPSHNNTSAPNDLGARQKSHIKKITGTDRLQNKSDSLQRTKLQKLKSRLLHSSFESEFQYTNKFKPYSSTVGSNRIQKNKSSDSDKIAKNSHNVNSKYPVPSLKVGHGKRLTTTTVYTSKTGTTTKNRKSKNYHSHKLLKRSSTSSVSLYNSNIASKGHVKRTTTKNSNIATTINYPKLIRTQGRSKSKYVEGGESNDSFDRESELPEDFTESFFLQNETPKHPATSISSTMPTESSIHQVISKFGSGFYPGRVDDGTHKNTLIKSYLNDNILSVLHMGDPQRVRPVNSSENEITIHKKSDPDLTNTNSNANLRTTISHDFKSKYGTTKEQLRQLIASKSTTEKKLQNNPIRNNQTTINKPTTAMKQGNLPQETSKVNHNTSSHQNMIPKRSNLELLSHPSHPQTVKSSTLNLSIITSLNKNRDFVSENVRNIGLTSKSTSEVNTNNKSSTVNSTITITTLTTQPTPQKHPSHIKLITSKTTRVKTEGLKSPKAGVQNENRPVTYSVYSVVENEKRKEQLQNTNQHFVPPNNDQKSHSQSPLILEHRKDVILPYTLLKQSTPTPDPLTKNKALPVPAGDLDDLNPKLNHEQPEYAKLQADDDNDNAHHETKKASIDEPRASAVADVINAHFNEFVKELTSKKRGLTLANFEKGKERQSQLVTQNNISSPAKQNYSARLVNANTNLKNTDEAVDAQIIAFLSGRDPAVDGGKSSIPGSGRNKISSVHLPTYAYHLLNNCESYNTWMDIVALDDDTVEKHISQLRLRFRSSCRSGVALSELKELTGSGFNALEFISNLGALCFFQLKCYHIGEAQVTIGKTKAFVGQCLKLDTSLLPYVRSFDYVWDFVRLFGSVREFEVSGTFNHFPQINLTNFVPHFNKLTDKVKAGVLGLKFYFYGVIKAPFSKQIELMKKTITLDGEYFEWHCCLQKLLGSKYRSGNRSSNQFLHSDADSSGTQEFKLDNLLKIGADAAWNAYKLDPTNLRCNLAVVQAFADLIRFRTNNNKWEVISFGLETFPTAQLCFAFLRDKAKYIVKDSGRALDMNLEIADIFTYWLPRRFRDPKLGKEILERCLRHHARSSAANCRMGQYYLNVHSNYDQAETYFDTALALDENNYKALEDLLLLMMRTVVKRQALILEVFRLQLDNSSWTKTQLANLHFLKGLTLLGVSNSKEAFQEFITAYQLNKHSMSFRNLSAIHEHYDWQGWPNRTVFKFGSMRLEAEFFQEKHLGEEDEDKKKIMGKIIKSIDKAEAADKKMSPHGRRNSRSLSSKTKRKKSISAD